MYLKFKIIFITLFVAVCPYILSGQGKITVRGIIKAASNGESLVGASVFIKGTTIGTSSDINGEYTLENIPATSILEVSMVSYVTQTISINDRTTIDILLQDDTQMLDQAVVIGYGTVKKSDATGSVIAIKPESMNKGLTTSPTELLSGKVAGVNIITEGGSPGGTANIRIRGGASLNASNDPLIVVDGTPISEGALKGVSNVLSFINPNDIETLIVLKDASSTAIYGSRGSNGVIIITTKTGKINSKLKVSYNGSVFANMRRNKIELLDADEYRELVKSRFGVNSEAYSKLGTSSTDWQKEIYRVAIGTEHNISATGAYKILPYRVSIGYDNQQGILKTSDFKRYSGAINLSPTFFENHLKININSKLTYIKNHYPDWSGSIGGALRFDPTQSVFDPNSKYGGYFTWTNKEGNPEVNAPQNPMSILNMKSKKSNAHNFIGSMMVDYKFHFLPDLKATLNLAYEYLKGKEHEYVDANAAVNYMDGGKEGDWSETKKNELLEFYFTYDKDIDAIKSNINLMAGYSWQHIHKKGDNFERSIKQDKIFSEGEFAGEAYLISFYGRLNYSLMDKYLLTFTLRDDASSRFSPDNRWGLFPSMALGWKIGDESFIKNLNVINELKLRLGWGITGHQNIVNDNYYTYIPRYLYSELGAYYQIGDEFLKLLRPSAYNKDIKWEETTTYNIGLDFGFWNNRLSGSVDLYKRITNDLISDVNIPAGTNFSNRVMTNFGSLENKGIEVSLNIKPIVNKEFIWDIGFNMAANKSEITKLSMFNDNSYTIQVETIDGGVGNFIQAHRIGYAPNSFFVYQQVYDSNGKPIEGVYQDLNKDVLINDQDRYLYKKPAPDVTFGLSNKFMYKNWDLGFSARANIGNYAYNNVASNFAGLGDNAIYNVGSLLNRPKSAFDTNFSAPQVLSDYYVQNASFLKVDNITLGYTFNKNSQAFLRVYATVQNPIIITKYKGLDPEVYKGIDKTYYPRPLMFMLGLNMNL